MPVVQPVVINIWNRMIHTTPSALGLQWALYQTDPWDPVKDTQTENPVVQINLFLTIIQSNNLVLLLLVIKNPLKVGPK